MGLINFIAQSVHAAQEGSIPESSPLLRPYTRPVKIADAFRNFINVRLEPISGLMYQLPFAAFARQKNLADTLGVRFLRAALSISHLQRKSGSCQGVDRHERPSADLRGRRSERQVSGEAMSKLTTFRFWVTFLFLEVSKCVFFHKCHFNFIILIRLN